MLAFGSGAKAETIKVGMGAFPAPPFFAPDASGNFSGWEVDILKAICADQKLDCEITGVSWDGLIPALTAGQIDMIVSSLSITERRMQIIDFSDKYYNAPAAIVATKGSEIEATPEGLAGKTVGVQVASVHEAYAQKYFTESALRPYKSFDEIIQDLVAGRIDATLVELPVVEEFLKSSSGDCCEIEGNVAPDVAIFGPGIGAGLRKGDTALKAKINDGIRNILANGTYDAISANYFTSSIYGD